MQHLRPGDVPVLTRGEDLRPNVEGGGFRVPGDAESKEHHALWAA